MSIDELVQNLQLDNNLNIQALLTDWLTESRVIDGKCDKCNQTGTLTLQSRIISTRQHILFHLQRYSDNKSVFHRGGKKNNNKNRGRNKGDRSASSSFTKNNQNVELGRTLMINGDEFDLTAIILHHGNSLSSGHYTAICNRGNPAWVHFDDEKVKMLGDEPPRSSSNAYILAYSKRKV